MKHYAVILTGCGGAHRRKSRAVWHAVRRTREYYDRMGWRATPIVLCSLWSYRAERVVRIASIGRIIP